MPFGDLKIPDNSWLLNTKIMSLPEAATSGFQQGLHLKDLFRQDQLGRLELEKANRAASVTRTQDELAKTIPQNTPQGRKKTAEALSQKGFGAESAEMQKAAEEWERKLRENREADRESSRKRLSLQAGYIRTLPPNMRVQAWWRLRRDLKEDGYDINDMPATPPNDQVLKELERQHMTPKEREAFDLDKIQLDETERHNRASEEIERNKPHNPQTGGLGIAYDEAGNMIVVDKVNRTAGPVSSEGGGRTVKKFEADPTKIKEAIAINKAKIKQIDDALAATEDYKKSTGLLPGFAGTFEPTAWALNKLDPKGVAARALVADVGSGKIHERTGAAMSIAETPRLKPFVPSTFDDYPVVSKKLPLFKKFLEDENRELAKTLPSAKVYDPQVPDDEEDGVEDAEFSEVPDDTITVPQGTNWQQVAPQAPVNPNPPQPKKKRNWSYGGKGN